MRPPTSGPGRVVRFAETAIARPTALAAILTWALERPTEWSHVFFRSAGGVPGLVGFRHAAGGRWRTAHVVALPGQVPRALEIHAVRTPDGPFDRLDVAAQAHGLRFDFDLPDERLFGLAIKLASGGGPVNTPNFLGFSAFCVAPIVDGLTVVAVRSGAEGGPELPFPGEAPQGCALPLHGATALLLRPGRAAPFEGVTLDFLRLGGFGAPGEVARLGAGLRLNGAPVDFAVDASDVGRLAGVVRLHVRPRAAEAQTSEAAWTHTLTLGEVPPELLLRGARWEAAGGPFVATPSFLPTAPQTPPTATDELGAVFRAGRLTLPAARRLIAPPPMATSLGLPGRDTRLGVAPDGRLIFRARGSAPEAAGFSAALHVALQLAERALPRPVRVLRDGVLTLSWSGLDVPLEATVSADETTAVLHLRSAEPRRLALVFTVRDGLLPLPGAEAALAAARLEGATAEVAAGEDEATLFFELPAGETGVRVVLPFPGTTLAVDAGRTPESAREAFRAAREAVFPGDAADFHLPDALWDAIARGLLEQAAMFFDGAGTVPYGRFPGVYDGDVFGLEEDWLFCGLAMWGGSRAAFEAFRATYLTDVHLDKAHSLHDLRNGLTPWQAARLVRLLGRAGVSDFPRPDEAARLRALGEWIHTRRAEPRVPGALPGLLPPFRYGGDLDFPTQSLSGNAVNVAGLHALGELGVDTHFEAEALEYRTAWISALDAAARTDADGNTTIPMHTGLGEPGQYPPLMVAGIVEPLGLLGPDEPRLHTLHDQMERTGALRMALPRFDLWGTGGRGIDAHYAVGYLWDQLLRGRPEVFATGLCGLLAGAMDPAVLAFREVGDLLAPGERPYLPDFLPGRLLGQAEPCVGGVGVTLQLLRQAFVCERPDDWGLPSRNLLILPGVPADGFLAGDLRWRAMQTAAGPVSLEMRNDLAARGEIALDIDAPGAESLTVRAPCPPGFRPVGPMGAETVTLPPGTHRLVWRFEAADGSHTHVGPPRVRAAIVPAAGRGTRLLPLTLGVPKELLPLGLYPALAATLIEAAGAGLRDVVVVVSPGKDAIRRAFDPDTWAQALRDLPAAVALRQLLERANLRFATQTEPRGALDAIACGRALLPDDDAYAVLYPDYVHLPDQRGLAFVLAAHAERGGTTFGLYLPEARAAVDGRFGATVRVLPAPDATLAPGLATPLVRALAPTARPLPGELRTMFAVVQDRRFDERLAAASFGGAPEDDALLPLLDALAREGELFGTLLPGEVLDLGVGPGYLEAARRFAAGEARLRL